MTETPFPTPAYTHLPGVNPRHPEAAFDDVRAATPEETRSETAGANPAWRFGLALLERGFYWEAHEVLEPVWWNAAPNSAERGFVRAVIQLANAALKQRMGRERAALRLCGEALALFGEAAPDGGRRIMGVRRADAEAAARALRQAVEERRIGQVALSFQPESAK